jgi:hypothetical protein
MVAIMVGTVHVSKHVLLPHRTHNFIIDVQPSLFMATMCVRVEHVHRRMPFACGHAVVVEHSIEKEAPEMGDEYVWKCFDDHRDLLARFAWVE